MSLLPNERGPGWIAVPVWTIWRKKSNLLSLPEIEPCFFGRPYLSVVAVLTNNNSAYGVKAFWKDHWHITTYLGNGVDPVVDCVSPFTKCLPTQPFHLRTDCVVLGKANVQIPKIERA